jgi:hypothetical protein
MPPEPTVAISDPVDDALGVTTAVLAAPPINGSPLVVVEAAALATPVPKPSSRRAVAAAAHASGAAAGASPPPAPNHESKLPLTPLTDPRAVAALITGASAAAGPVNADTDTPDSTAGAADVGESVSTGESFVGNATGSETSVSITARGDGADAGAGAEPLDPLSTVVPSGAGVELFRRLGAELAAEPPGTPERPARVEEVAPSDEELSSEAADPAPGPEDPRPLRAGLDLGEDFDAASDDDASAELDPVEPADPVVSANATGTDATADPTPNATASAPTRPT